MSAVIGDGFSHRRSGKTAARARVAALAEQLGRPPADVLALVDKARRVHLISFDDALLATEAVARLPADAADQLRAAVDALAGGGA